MTVVVMACVTAAILAVLHFFHGHLVSTILIVTLVLSGIGTFISAARLSLATAAYFGWPNDNKEREKIHEDNIVVLNLFRHATMSVHDTLYFVAFSYAVLLFLLGPMIDWSWLAASFALAGAAMHDFGRRSAPPFAIVLGASGSQPSHSLSAKVAKHIRPLTSTDLLAQAPQINKPEIWHQKTKTRLQNEMLNWKAAVEAHLLVCKLILIDLRDRTNYVEDELHLIERHGLWYKTVLVREGPFEEEPRPLPSGAGQSLAIDVGRLNRLLAELLRQPKELPSADSPICRLAARLHE